MDAYEVKEGLKAEDFIAAPDKSLRAGMRCVEFDFTSDEPMETIYFEGTGANDGIEEMPADAGAEGSDMEMNPGSSGGYTPGMMSPFMGAPVATTVSGEEVQAD